MPSWKKVIISGSNAELSSLIAPSITGSLQGTASFARTASFVTGSNVFGPFGSNSIISASFAVSASRALTSSFAGTAGSSSYAIYAATASYSTNAADIVIYVKNTTGTQIDKGKVVRITGATGNNALISTASYESDPVSANTLGITRENIANDAFGYVITEGTLLGIDTDLWTAGQLLFLGASGSITGSAPLAPLHAVRLGQVLRVQQNNGSMYVRIDNGYEIGELHDVIDSTTTSTFGDLLVKSGSVWRNSKQLTGPYGVTGSFSVRTPGASGIILDTDINNDLLSSRLFFKISGSGQDISMRNSNGSLFFGYDATAGNASGPYMMIMSSSAVSIGNNYTINASRGAILQLSGSVNIEDGFAYKQDGENVIYIQRNTGITAGALNNTIAGQNAAEGTAYFDQMTAFGYTALYQSSGSDQTAFGYAAGSFNSGSSQTLIGWGAGYLGKASNQTAVGEKAGWENTGSNQTAIGIRAGQYNSGSNQTAIGTDAGVNNTATQQTAVGLQAGYENIGVAQTALGQQAGQSNSGSNQTVVGYAAGFQNSGSFQTAIGANAGRDNKGLYQTAVGNNAGRLNTGSSQTAVGFDAGYENTGIGQTTTGYAAGYENTGSYQSAYGYQAGTYNSGSNQTATGFQAGVRNIGNNQTVTGYQAGYENTGSNQSAFGYQAGFENSGSNQVAIGSQAGYLNTGNNQTVTGYQAGYGNIREYQTTYGYRAGYLTTASYQTAIGPFAGREGSSSLQTAIGWSAGEFIRGEYQTAIGAFAGRFTTASNQTAVGYVAGEFNSARDQTAVGFAAGRYNTGSAQTAVGYGAGTLNSGSNQTVVGYGSGQTNKGEYQTAIGVQAGFQNSGDDQTAVGYFAGAYNSGSDNTNIGYQAGLYITGTGGTFNSQSAQSVFLGSQTTAGGGNRTNQIVIGYNASGIGSNSVVLGNNSILTTALKGFVGIGTTSPTASLHVNNTTTSASFLVEDSTNPDTTPFIIDALGNVGIGNTTPSAKLTVQVTGSAASALVANFIKSPASSNETGSTFIRISSFPILITGSGQYTDIEYNSGYEGPFRYGTYADTNIINGIQSTNGQYGNINFVTSGSTRMTVAGGTRAGNVGIGTTNPLASLHTTGSVIVANSMVIGSSSLGPFENTLTLGARDSVQEGGQVGFNAAGGTYTSASFIDLYQNRLRILKGTNATSTGEVANWNMHNLQMALPAYSSVSSFPGTAAGYLAFDSSGNIITVAAGNPFPFTGSAQITGSLSVNNALFTSTTATANIGSTTIYSVSTSSYDGAWFEYTARSGSNARAGQIMAIDSGSAVNFTETTTTDFGSTSGLALGVYIVNGAMALTASATTNGWSIKTIVRSI